MVNKVILLTSLTVITSLFGCSNNKSFTATLNVLSGEELTLSHKVVDPNTDYETYISFDSTRYPNLSMPSSLTSLTINNDSINDYTYTINRKDSAVLKIDKSLLKGDITITINGLVGAKWYDISNWWDYCSNGVIDEQASAADIGKEVNITVNNQIHKVRLIDVDHDDLADSNKKAHCTFEFVNLISDNNGNSLAIPYDLEKNNNTDFPNSTLRNALDGGGKSKRQHNKPWYQKEEEEPSKVYSGKSVLEMLPKELQSKIKSVNKQVFIYQNNNYEITTYSTRIFPLSKDEIDDSNNNDSKEGEIYQYYKQNNFHMHKQINNSVDFEPYSINTKIPDYDYVMCYAGVNSNDVDNPYGGAYYFRTPFQGQVNKSIGAVDTKGIYIPNNFIFDNFFNVSPAFCI